jgi:hypothetical protein
MAVSDPALNARIVSLESQVRELTQRVAALEAQLRNNPKSGHRVDRDTVREKVAYDWQK